MVKFIQVLFLGFIFSTSSLFASDFTLNSDTLIDKRTVSKINEIGNELKSKTQISVYVHVKNNFGMKKSITTKEKITFFKFGPKVNRQSLVKRENIKRIETVFDQDLKKCLEFHKPFGGLFLCESKTHPPIVKLLLQKKISIHIGVSSIK